VLGRVDACHARALQGRLVLGWDDAADHDRHMAEPLRLEAAQDLRPQRHMAAGEDGEADDMDALLERGVDDLRRREANALINHLESRVARLEGHLLGAARMAVETRLADEEFEPPS